MSVPDVGRRAPGFTLLEILVAFAIAILGLQLATQTIGDQGGLLVDGRRTRMAVAWADATMAALGRTAPLTPGLSDGTLPGGQHWRLAVTRDLPSDDRGQPSHPSLYRVELLMSWPSWTGTRSARFETLKLVTGPDEPPP